MDAEVAPDERGGGVRQRRVVPTSRSWRQCTWRLDPPGRYGGKRAVLRGEHAISRKATAQGMSDVLRCPVCSCACSLVHVAHETAGAARIRHSLRPLNWRGRNDLQNFGHFMPRECKTAFCEDSIHVSSRRRPGPIRRGLSARTQALATF